MDWFIRKSPEYLDSACILTRGAENVNNKVMRKRKRFARGRLLFCAICGMQEGRKERMA